MLEIDGSEGEGGGQILRTSLALAALTKKPFRLFNIRKNRQGPGLKPQHLQCVKAVQQLCSAEVTGVFIGSEKITFIPEAVRAKNIYIDIGTAGSTTLVLQALLLPCLFADRQIRIMIEGGTANRFAPPFEYFQNILLPYITRLADVDARLLRRGYFPKGQGKVEVRIRPKIKSDEFNRIDGFLAALNKRADSYRMMEKGVLLSIHGVSHASKRLMSHEVAERQARAAKLFLNKHHVPVSIRVEYSESSSPGSGIVLWARIKDRLSDDHSVIGGDQLGEKGKKAEDVGREAAEILDREIISGSRTDSLLADQLLIFASLLDRSSYRTSMASSHLITNKHVIESFLPVKISINKNVISTQLSCSA